MVALCFPVQMIVSGMNLIFLESLLILIHGKEETLNQKLCIPLKCIPIIQSIFVRKIQATILHSSLEFAINGYIHSLSSPRNVFIHISTRTSSQTSSSHILRNCAAEPWASIRFEAFVDNDSMLLHLWICPSTPCINSIFLASFLTCLGDESFKSLFATAELAQGPRKYIGGCLGTGTLAHSGCCFSSWSHHVSAASGMLSFFFLILSYL